MNEEMNWKDNEREKKLLNLKEKTKVKFYVTLKRTDVMNNGS